MTDLQSFQTENRRRNRQDRRQCQEDRRQCQDRRSHPLPVEDAVDENELLRELLGEAHARIRALEQAIDKLTKVIG
jgi:hypothetical protein